MKKHTSPPRANGAQTTPHAHTSEPCAPNATTHGLRARLRGQWHVPIAIIIIHNHTTSPAPRRRLCSLRPPGGFHERYEGAKGTGNEARAEVTPLEKALLIGCARLWAATAMSGTRGACVVSSDQAPRRARSMGARGSGLFNGVTQNASLLAFQRPHKRHSLHFNVTLGIVAWPEVIQE